ncbi:MAG: galactokinase [Clostridia bacterium]|nr:galactokinase [Clostridia bacterium]
MKIEELRKKIGESFPDKETAARLAIADAEKERKRYLSLLDGYEKLYGTGGDLSVFSVGGRSEISGNHTDHNHGRVIAASVNLDIIAAAAPAADGVIRIKSEGFDEDVVTEKDSQWPDPEKYYTSSAIIAGMRRAFENAGHRVGGFTAYTASNVLKGSGVSSSAAFEVMVGNILNHLYCGGKVPNVEIAKMAQWSENVFFGKPCGLMDQTACAVGGFITIDFLDPANPVIEALDFDLTARGYSLCVVNTGGNHADLNEDYASVPREMKDVASCLGGEVMRGFTTADVVGRIGELREKCGDRAVLRALHFIGENNRVGELVEAIKRGDVDSFLYGITESGNSSFKYLQNVYTTQNVKEQGLSVALCLTDNFLRGKKAAHRVHGGGFAGTIQAFVPVDYAREFKSLMDSVFGDGACYILSVRPAGAVRVI